LNYITFLRSIPTISVLPILREISNNLRTLIKIAEKEGAWLSFYKVYKPKVWRMIFS